MARKKLFPEWPGLGHVFTPGVPWEDARQTDKGGGRERIELQKTDMSRGKGTWWVTRLEWKQQPHYEVFHVS